MDITHFWLWASGQENMSDLKWWSLSLLQVCVCVYTIIEKIGGVPGQLGIWEQLFFFILGWISACIYL